MSRFNGEGPIFGIDLDGTLADYHGHFIRFAEMYTGRSLPDPSQINPGQPFRKFLGLGGATYRDIKLAYRLGGMKRSMPCYAGAGDLTASLRRGGAEVWITTSRPYNQLGNVDKDTRHWLRRNHIQYDNILWGERKYKDLARLVGARVVGVLEDLPEMRMQALENGLTCYFRTQPYNLHVQCWPNRVDDLFQAKKAMLRDLQWTKEQAKTSASFESVRVDSNRKGSHGG